MSYHRLSVKPLNVTLNTLLKRAAHVGLGVGAFTPILALANPTGGQVVAGQATIATPNANGLVINQASQAAIINWQQFSIGKGQYVQFLQPSSSSVVLNRVVGGNASSILGNLNANGQVFLVNPNGIFFGKSASLDVQGIVASTLDITNSDFLTGHYVFQKGTGANNASVVNQGNISTHNGGYVVLAGDYAENDGIIQARSGHVVLASGTKSTLTLSGNSLVNFAVNSATLAELAGVSNTGSLIADGGTVVMTADVANALKATVVNNTGLIEAHAINKNNGTITLTATGGNIVNAGTLDADAGRAGQAGGAIVLKTDGLTDLTDTSKITATGNGADGGHLEISGQTINVRGSAKLGKGGNMLLDPTSVELVAGSGTSGVHKGTGSGENATVGVTFIQTQLNAGANVSISAHNLIHASTGVHAITATTKPGNLSLKVGSNGAINLGGVDITIAGALTASFGYGNFGFIQAKSAAFTANNSTGSLRLHAATVVSGAVTKNSVKATGGDVTVTGKTKIVGSDSDMYSIQATGNVNLGSANIGNTSVSEMGITLVGKSVTDTGGIDVGSTVNVTATAGAVTLGDISAFNNVTVAATGGNLTVGAVLTHNAGDNIILSDTTGNLTAGQIEAGGALTVTDVTGNVHLGDIAAYGGALTVTDTTGNMTVGIVSGGGAINLNDGAHILSFDHSAGSGNATVYAHGALSLKAATIQTTGDELFLKASSAGAITVKGTMSLTNKDLVIDDAEGGTISLDHNVAARNVTLTGTQLAFIGAAPTFSISAGYGNLTLDAAIGTSVPTTGGVKYNVNLKDQGYGIFIEKSIFTGDTAGGLAANLTATQTGHSGSSRTLHGVLVDNAAGMVVSVAGNITLKGWDVGVGHVISGGPAASGSIQVKAGKNVTFSASGSGSRGGAVGVQAHAADVNTATKRNTSVLVQAGGNIKFVGKHVDIRAGSAEASLGNNGSGSASANVSLKAGGNVTLTGGASNSGHVNVDAGNAFASGNVSGATKKVNANANVSITAGNSIILSGHNVTVSGGYGNAEASAHGSVEAGNMTATANANVSLTAKTGNITLTADNTNGTAKIRTAGFAGSNGYGSAVGTSNNATANAHGDVTLKAGGGISLTGNLVELSVGYGAGFQTSGTGHQLIAHAQGNKDVATFTATNNLSLTAGVGGVTLTGVTGAFATAGGGILNGASAEADGNGTKATATASGRVDIVTTGAFTATGNDVVEMFTGYSAAARTKAEGNEGGSAAIAGNGGLAITAAAITVGSAGGHSASIQVRANNRAAASAQAHASGSYGGATVTGLSSLSMTATGAIKIAGGRFVNIDGGSGAARAAEASASGGGKAAVNAADNVNLVGASLKVTSTNQGVGISAGYGAANGAVAKASYGSAAVTANSGVNLTIAGNITLTGKNNVGVRGGESAAAGFQTGRSSNTGSHTFGSHGSFSHTHNQITVIDYTSASAKGAGAKATVSGNGAMTVTAKGTLTISQTNAASGSVQLDGGGDAAYAAHTQASDGAAAAAVTGTGALSIKAGALTVNGFRVSVGGGGGAARGASSSRHTRTRFGQMSFGEGLQSFGTAGTTTFSAPKVNTANGAGATAKVSGDGSVTIKTGALSLTGGNDVNISAGYGGGSHDLLKASYGGLTSVSAKTGVNITATAFTATSKLNQVELRGEGGSGGDDTSVDAHGTGAQALLTANGQVNLTATTVTLTAAGEIVIEGGDEAANGATVKADESNSAKLISDGSVNIKGGTVSLTATTGNLDISGGYGGGSHTHIQASSGGLASISAKTGVNITATTFTAATKGNTLELRGAGGSGGDDTSLNANGSGAQALLTVNGQVNVTATTVTLTAANGIEIEGNGGGASQATVKAAGAGASAKLVGDASVNIKGGTVSLTATAGNLDISAGYGGGSGALVKASYGGLASISAKAGVGIIATTAFTAAAGGSLRITAADEAGRDASLNAHASDAQALMNVDHRITLSAPTVSLNGGTSIFIGGGGEDGSGASVKAGAGGSAALTTNASVNITAATAFTAALTGATAHGDIELHGGSRGGRGASIGASGSGAKATLSGNDDVNITATGGTITLQTGKHVGASLEISAGSETAENMSATATQGTATATLSANVNLTAAGAITLNAAKGYINLNADGGGNSAARGAFASAAAGGKTTVTASDNINLTGGAVTLKAGAFASSGTHHTIEGGNIGIHVGQEDVASHAFAGASAGGSANLTTNTQVNLKATGGALTIAGGGDVSIGYGCCSRHTGFSASAGAGGGNAKAALDINDGMTFQATGAVTLTAGTNLSITTASGPSAAGASAGFKGQTAFNVNSAINIVAGGAFTAKAGTDLDFSAGLGGGGNYAHASHAGAQASFQSNGGLNITAATVAMSAGESVELFAGDIGGWKGSAGAINGGTAAFTSNRNLNVTAKNSIIMTLTGKTSGGRIEVEGGSSVGLGAQAHASHGGGKATVTDTANLNLTVTAGTGIITLTAGSHTGADVTIEARSVAEALSSASFTTAKADAGKGGSAAVIASGTVNLSAKGAVTVNAGTSGDLLIKAGGHLVSNAQAQASSGGKATVNASATTIISGGTVTLTGGSNVSITGASKVAGIFSGSGSPHHVGVNAQRGGIAAITATDGTTIISKGALTVTAGNDLTLYAGGSSSHSPAQAARSASVNARSGNAVATLNVTNGVRLTAATIALKATKGDLSIEAASDAGESAQVSAGSRKDKATLNVDDSIAINATGAITANAGGSLSIEGGLFTGVSAGVHAGNQANASLTATAGVTIKAGGAFTAKAANGDVDIEAGGAVGASGGAQASDQGVAAYSANAGINITASAISITAATVATATSPGEGAIFIEGGGLTGIEARADAFNSGHANYSAVSNVSLSATGAITLAAKGGDLVVRSRGEGFQQNQLNSDASGALHASGSGGGVAKAATDGSVNITAGGALGLSAKGNIAVSGGYGEFAIVNAAGGSASATLNGGVNLKAVGAVTATAGGNISLLGGSRAGIAADLFLGAPPSFSAGPGVVNGTVNTGVSLAGGGAVTLTAGTNVTVAAGNGETLAVGAIRSFPPSPSTSGVTFLGANVHAWGGGSANLSANLGVSVTAGKALTVTAGATGVGSLQVLGLGKNPGASNGFQNVVSVRGGSSHAVANLTLNGNATLTAGSDIILNAAGNASIAGGALFNIRADHTIGDITLTGSANATVHAGLDVVLNNIKGNLTLAGANAGPSGQEMLVDARGSAGTVNVTGHADALISAGRDVVTVTKMGGGLNLIAGGLVAAVALGGSSGAATNETAIATANAGIKAGRNVTITATGGLNLLGGDFDEASISSIGRNQADLTDNVTLTARADITAGTKVTLTVGGDAFIAGGNSLHANVEYSGDAFVAGNATADVGTGIQAGAVTLTVGGNLKARGGSGANALVEAFTSDASAHANANAGVTIAATAKTGALAITANGANASFLGGSGATGKAEVLFGSNSATAVAHSDLTLSAGGAMSLKIKGTLLVAGGADADQFGTDIGGAPAGRLAPASIGPLTADNSKVNVTTTGAVNFTAGTTLTVAQAGGDLSILAGSRGASFGSVNAVGSNARTSLNVDTGVHIKAGGALAFTGAHNVTIVAGRFAASSATPFLFSSGAGAHATATVDNSVKLTGTSVHIAHTGTFTTNSSGSFTSGGLSVRGSFSSAAVAAPHALGAHTLSVRGLAPRTEMIHVAPMTTQSSFGGAKTLSGMPVTDISDSTPVQPVTLDATADGVSVDITAQTLATLQETSLVTNLVTVAGSDTAELMAASSQDGKATLFTPAISNSYSSSFSGACVALVVSRSGQSRCSVAGSK